MDRGVEKVMESAFGVGYRCRGMGRHGSRWGLMLYWCGVGGGDAQREAEEESSLCVERSEGWGCTCVGRRCGEVGRVLFRED